MSRSTSEAPDREFLFQLESLIRSRKEERPDDSYTTHLFEKGIDKIAQKVGEEAIEVVIASKNEDDGELIYETADLLYHLLVLLAQKEIPLETILQELRKRHS